MRHTFVAFGLIAASLPAQTWAMHPFGVHPGDRIDASVAYDSAAGSTVLFGHAPQTGAWPVDTWLFDGATWMPAAPTTNPPGRVRHTMAFDIARGRVVMFGGRGQTGVLDDTWEWDGTNWNATTPVSRPPARYAHASAYDLLRGVTVVFGGTTSDILPRTRTDTWEWNGTGWAQAATAHAPSEAEDTAMCYDLARGRCVLAGGTSFFGAPDQKTWEYDGLDWLDVTAAVGPGPTAIPGLGVMDAQMVYDVARQRCVLHGGRTPNGTFPIETWEYDGTAWTRVATSGPPSRTRFVMAMDLARNKVVLYGGTNGAFTVAYHDTWDFTGAPAASYAMFAPGCAGGLGVPTNVATSLPRLGQTLGVAIGNVPAPEVGLLYLGFSATASAFGPLPIDLTALQAPGCFLRVSTDLELLGFGAGATIGFSQPVPNSAALLALPFFTQAFVLAPGVNAFGVIASDAAAGIVGT